MRIYRVTIRDKTGADECAFVFDDRQQAELCRDDLLGMMGTHRKGENASVCIETYDAQLIYAFDKPVDSE